MTTVVRPPRLDRVLFVVAFGPVGIGTGIAVASVAFVPGASARVFCFVLGAAFVAVGTVVSVRLPRVGIRMTDDRLEYVGFLVSWRAPRSGIRAVLDDAFVEWRDEHDVEHRRQLWVLTPAYEDDGTVFARYWRWRRAGLLQVRAWADARAV
ncbi:hypothetical protein [Curtobacterium sp. L1-20]|uniref:hypothetical protein n=1 Tax=Curtobacterium sp. L1-20 TaxID=3138181 RepID=UPI003B524FE9